MAGLFDTIGRDPIAEARAAEQARFDQQQQQLLANLRQGFTPAGNVGLAVGSALAGGFGRRLAEGLGYESPEMQAAKKQMAVVKAMQGQDLNTSEGMRAAAKAARDAGDEMTALNLTYKAGQLAKEEAKLKAETEAAAKEQALKEWNGLPTAVQEEIIAADPEKVIAFGGVTDPKRIAEIQQKVAERNQFTRAKLEKAAQDITRASGVDVSSNDEQRAAITVRGMLGMDESFSGISESMIEPVIPLVAARSQRMQAEARDKGVTLDPSRADAMAMQQLMDEGVVVKSPGITYGHNVSVDATKLQAPTETKPAAPAADKPPVPGARKAPDGFWYSPDPNRPGKYIKH